MSNRFIQAHNGNFELLAFENKEGGRLLNLTCDNSAPGRRWTTEEAELLTRIISTTAGSSGAIIQSTHSTNGFEILVPERSRLQRFFLDKSDETNIKIEDRDIVSETWTGFQSFIRSRPNLETNPDAHGNFEAVVLEADGLVHYRLVNASPTGTWTRGQVISGKATAPGCIIQSTLELEVVVPESGNLVHYTLDNSRGNNGCWALKGIVALDVCGPATLIQSSIRTPSGVGRFEVVVEHKEKSGKHWLVHYWKDPYDRRINVEGYKGYQRSPLGQA